MSGGMAEKIQRVLDNGKEPEQLVQEATQLLIYSNLSSDTKDLIAHMAEMIQALDISADYRRERSDDFEAQVLHEVKKREDAEFFYEHAIKNGATAYPPSRRDGTY